MRFSSKVFLIAAIISPSVFSSATSAFVVTPKQTPLSPMDPRLIPETPGGPNARLRSKTTRRHENVSSSVASLVPKAPTNPSASLAIPKQNILSRLEGVFNIDTAVCTAYFFNVLVLSLPIILVPLAVTEHAGSLTPSTVIAAKVATISSMASIGGAMGKFMNGFVCQELGTYTCSRWYLVGLAVCSLFFSLSTNTLALGVSIAGMEFFASVQCASLAVMLSDYYKGNLSKLTAGLTAMGLSATMGEVMAKVLGTSLTTSLNWRQVARIGAVLAVTASTAISVAPGQREARAQRALTKQPFNLSSVTGTLRGVLGNSLFWKLSVAYSMAFVASISDRIMGPFFHSATNLPMGVCGGLTLSITLGLVYGLVTASRKIVKLQGTAELGSFLRHRYIRSIAATFGLTVLATLGPTVISNPIVMASLLVLLSFIMAANIAYQCYQLPAMIAKHFPGQQAVVISFLDGFGYLFSVPLFASLGMIVPKYGWSPSFGLLTILFGAGAALMMRSVPPILKIIADGKKE